MEESLPAPRTPEQDDIVKLCAALNEQGALYLVVGGVAVNQQGFLRATEGIDLLVEDSRENQSKVLQALTVLHDKAVSQVEAGDLDQYTVVRVADENRHRSHAFYVWNQVFGGHERNRVSRNCRSENSLRVGKASSAHEKNLSGKGCCGSDLP